MGNSWIKIAKEEIGYTRRFIKEHRLWSPIFYPLLLAVLCVLGLFTISLVMLTGSLFVGGNIGVGMLTTLIVAGINICVSLFVGMLVSNITFTSYREMATTGECKGFCETVKFGYKGCFGFFIRQFLNVLLPTVLITALILVYESSSILGFICNYLLGILNCLLIYRFYAKELKLYKSGLIKENLATWLSLGLINGLFYAIPYLAIPGVFIVFISEFHIIFTLVNKNITED